MNEKETLNRWLQNAVEDPDLGRELTALVEAGDEDGIHDRF